MGQLLDDVPGFLFLMAGAALGGQVVVGLNPTRRGAALAADVARADVQVVVADPTYAALLGDVDVAVLKRELAAVGPVAGDGTLWARAPRGTSYLPA